MWRWGSAGRYQESARIEPGSEVVVAETLGVSWGWRFVTICGLQRFSSHLPTRAARLSCYLRPLPQNRRGALEYPGSGPGHRNPKPMVACNQGDSIHPIENLGHTQIVDAWGQCLMSWPWGPASSWRGGSDSNPGNPQEYAFGCSPGFQLTNRPHFDGELDQAEQFFHLSGILPFSMSFLQVELPGRNCWTSVSGRHPQTQSLSPFFVDQPVAPTFHQMEQPNMDF